MLRVGVRRILSLVTLTLTSSMAANVLDVARDNGCGKIVSFIETAGLTDAVRNADDITFFAPSDAAVSAFNETLLSALARNVTLLQRVLQFHVTSHVTRAADVRNDLVVDTLAAGARMRLNVYESTRRVALPTGSQVDTVIKVVTAEGARVSRADLEADNGVVHVVDRIVYPLPEETIPLTLTFDPSLASLAYIVYRSNLTDNFNSEDLTIFAPTNAAIDRLGFKFYNDLLLNVTRAHEFVYNHVVRGVVFSAGLQSGGNVTNALGDQLSVDIDAASGEITVDGVSVTAPDLAASNGAIHAIDGVLLPN